MINLFAINVIEIDQKPYTAEDFINERVAGRNFTRMLCDEIDNFNEIQREIAKRDGVGCYECVYIGRHNPHIHEDFYYPYIGKVNDEISSKETLRKLKAKEIEQIEKVV